MAHAAKQTRCLRFLVPICNCEGAESADVHFVAAVLTVQTCNSSDAVGISTVLDSLPSFVGSLCGGAAAAMISNMQPWLSAPRKEMFCTMWCPPISTWDSRSCPSGVASTSLTTCCSLPQAVRPSMSADDLLQHSLQLSSKLLPALESMLPESIAGWSSSPEHSGRTCTLCCVQPVTCVRLWRYMVAAFVSAWCCGDDDGDLQTSTCTAKTAQPP